MNKIQKTLLYHLDRILRDYIKKEDERKHHLEQIISQFQNVSNIKYPLDEISFLILTKDERKISNLRRYYNSPFPLLSNLERFSNTIGQWNDDLLAYGIKTRQKLGDSGESEVGVRIHLAYYKTMNSQGNRYLKRQYKRLSLMRKQGKVLAYWKLGWTLMLESWSFKIACLNSWQPRWYKDYSFLEIQRIFKGLNKILNLEEIKTLIYNVWIESPKGKWRQLGVPKKSWRLYLHILNMLISYIYEPHLPSEKYEGFVYNRGCKSWWEDLLWGKLLKTYSSLVEVDLSSGFPNLNRLNVRQALLNDGLIPVKYINLIMSHLNSPLKESSWFPTLNTLIENSYNQVWRKSNRSVHMGLGISPILFVITLNWALTQERIENKNLSYKWYADDGSFYFNLIGLIKLINQKAESKIWLLKELLLGRNVLVSLLNEIPLFRETGIKFCPQKSSLVRIFGLWLKPYQSLGLSLYTNMSILNQLKSLILGKSIPLELMGWTRGRGANPLKGKRETFPSRTKLAYKKRKEESEYLNLTKLLADYKDYFGLLIARLYSNEEKKPEFTPTTPLKKGSILWELKRRLRMKSNRDLAISLNVYNSGCKLNELLLRINNSEQIPSEWLILNSNLVREFKVAWKINCLVEQELNSLKNPLPLKENEELTNLSYFKKYSEIKLDDKELRKFQEDYSEQKPRN